MQLRYVVLPVDLERKLVVCNVILVTIEGKRHLSGVAFGLVILYEIS